MAALCHRLLQFDHCALELTDEALALCAAHGDERTRPPEIWKLVSS
jgi:hypothetical protein